MKTPKIFLSYAWKSKEIANKIYNDLSSFGFRIIKDDHTLKYQDRISEFMNNIKKSDFAILVICDDYLKSINCMTEIMLLRKDSIAWERALPVLKPDIKLFDLSDRVDYIKYWQEKSEIIETSISNLNPKNSISIRKELNTHLEITQNIGSLLSDLKDQLNITTTELFDSFYHPLTDKMKIEPDLRFLTDMIPISFIKNPHSRLRSIQELSFKKKLENSWCYSIMGGCYRDMDKPIKAIQFYKKALELDPLNESTWNNIGRVYEHNIHNYSEAKMAYLKAIDSAPKFDTPRLNLGTLLSDKFNDINGAVEQYLEILNFDENNPKAHNNLGNIYRGSYNDKSFKDRIKAEMHFKIAVKQDLLEAFVNYGNFMHNDKKDIEAAKELYLRAKELDTKNQLSEVLDLLLKMCVKK